MKFTRAVLPLFGLMFLAATTVEAQSPKHRYSFEGDTSDSVGGANGTIVDAGTTTNAVFSGGMLDFSANTGEGSNAISEDAYVDLPNGMITAAVTSGTSGAISLEWWATVAEIHTWQRFGDFGTSDGGEDTSPGGQGSSYILVTPNSGRYGNGLEITNHPSSNAAEPNVGVAGPFPVGEEAHVVAVYDHTDTSAGANGTMSLYLNGGFRGSNEIHPDIDLRTMDDNNNWLGRSQWNDPMFDGSFNEFRVHDQALNGDEVFVSGVAGPNALASEGPVSPGGSGAIGSATVVPGAVDQDSLQFGPDETGSGLAQEWFAAANPGNKDAVDAIFDGSSPVVAPFRSSGGSFWTGSGGDLPGVQNYPPEVQPQLTDNYTVRLSGEILIEGSGPFTFTDGVDDFAYLAIDTDKSGVAGDIAEEILINDNTWTTNLRDGNGGGEGYAEITIDGIVAGGEWLAIEANVAEGGGGDSGTFYWDFDTTAPEGQRHGGILLPFVDQAFFSVDEAAGALIPDTHLRSTTNPLISGNVNGSLPAAPLGWQIDVNATDGTSDAFALGGNPDPDIFTTNFDVDGVEFIINVTDGEVADGDSFQVVIADNITGTPTVSTSGWSFNAATGSLVFGGGTQTCGDFDNDGDVDSADRTIQTTNWTGALPPGDPNATKTFAQGDCDGDGDVDTADQNGTITNWTGAMNAGNLVDGDDADLVYNPASGNVTLDASDTGAGQFISFVLGTDQNNMRTENFVEGAPGNAGPFFDVGTNTDNTPFQIGQTDPLNQGAGPEINLGDILPAGMDLAGLAEYLTLAEYASDLGAGGTLDLRVIPEPSSLTLALFGLLGLMLRRRRA